jgi:hypothetical protein
MEDATIVCLQCYRESRPKDLPLEWSYRAPRYSYLAAHPVDQGDIENEDIPF